MSGYTLPFTITPRIIDLVASVSEKTGQILSRKDLENKPHLRRSNMNLSLFTRFQTGTGGWRASRILHCSRIGVPFSRR